MVDEALTDDRPIPVRFGDLHQGDWETTGGPQTLPIFNFYQCQPAFLPDTVCNTKILEDSMDALLELCTFGELTIKRDEVPIGEALAQKARALLVYLACDSRAHRRERLANLLWDKGDDRRLMNNLRVLLSGMRRELVPYVTITRETVAFNLDSSHWLDVTVMEEELATARAQVVALGSLSADALSDLSKTLELYRGDFLEGFHLRDGQGFVDWMLMQQEHWRLEILEARKRLVGAALVHGEYHLGLEHVRAWLDLDPLTEAAHRQAMVLYARTGHWDRALQQYELCRQILADELGIEPAVKTTLVYQAIKTKTVPPAPDQPDGPGARPVDRVWITSPEPAGRAGSPEMPATAFVGRRRQLETLATALQSARKGNRQIRFVTGGAGRGKSMLVQEFARQAQHTDPGLLVACGHGHDQTGQGEPYLPWREALAMLSGEVEAGQNSDPIPDWQAQRLRAAMPVTIPALVARGPALIDSLIPAEPLQQRAAAIAPEDGGWFEQLQTQIATRTGSSLRQKKVFTQVAGWLKTVAACRPLLLILEDLHWADPASCSLLFYLSRHLGDSPILLLGTYRPEALVGEEDRERHPLAGVIDELKRHYGDIWLDLGRLGEAEDRQFVADYLDSQPNRLGEPFREALFGHTGGHPLFTVELVQSMQTRSELVQDESGRWMVAQAIDWQALPARVEGTIESRINRLDEALRHVLTVASVQGERFTAEVVARVQGRDELAVIRQLSRELDRQQRLVSAQGVKRLGPGGQRLSRYRFRHHLFQQYLYQRLDEPERVYLHLAVGAALEEFYGKQADRASAPLARHFRQAGLPDKAASYLLTAGKQAMRLGAYTEAAAHLTSGLELVTRMPDSPARTRQELDLQLTLGHALIPTQGYATPAVKDCFEMARLLCSQVGETPQMLPVSYALIVYYLMRAELPLAEQLGGQFLRHAGRQGDSTALTVGHRAVGTTLLYLGQLSAARRHLEESINGDDPARHQAVAAIYFQSSSATGRIDYAFNLCLLGYPAQARQQVEEALRLAEADTYPMTKAMVLSLAAAIHGHVGDLTAAQRYAEAAIVLAGQHEIVFWGAVSQIVLFAVQVQQGAAGLEAVTEMCQALARYQATGARLGLPYLLYLLAGALIKLDQPEQAQARLAEALAVGEETGHRLFESELVRLQGELLARQGAPGVEVEACFEQAVNLARKQQARWFELRAMVSLCRLRQSLGKIELACQELAGMYDWFSEGFDTPDLVEGRELLDGLRETQTELVAVQQ